jgi:hypothetical protein
LTIVGQTRDGEDVDITISGNDSMRVFEVANGAALTVKNLTVADGFDSVGGGGILNQEGGTLTVIDSTVSDNSATDPEGVSVPTGGGIANDNGALTVTNSTFSSNIALSKDEDSPNDPPPKRRPSAAASTQATPLKALRV